MIRATPSIFDRLFDVITLKDKDFSVMNLDELALEIVHTDLSQAEMKQILDLDLPKHLFSNLIQVFVFYFVQCERF